METRKRAKVATGIAILLVLFVSGCNKSSGTSTDSSQASGSGADYFPLSGNQTLSGKVTYQVVAYDSTGQVTGSYAVTGQDMKGYIGAPVTSGNIQGYPLYGYAQDGKTLMPSEVTAVQQNQSVVFVAQPGQNITMLPKDLSVGTEWVANPFSPPDEQLTLKITEVKPSYVNSAGSTYSDVIVVSASFSDSLVTPNDYRYDGGSSYWYSYHDTTFVEIVAGVELYFARGIGLVEATLSHYDVTDRSSWSDSSYNTYNSPQLQISSGTNYQRTVATGSLGRTDLSNAGIAQNTVEIPAPVRDIRKPAKKIRLLDLLFPKFGVRAIHHRLSH